MTSPLCTSQSRSPAGPEAVGQVSDSYWTEWAPFFVPALIKHQCKCLTGVWNTLPVALWELTSSAFGLKINRFGRFLFYNLSLINPQILRRSSNKSELCFCTHFSFCWRNSPANQSSVGGTSWATITWTGAGRDGRSCTGCWTLMFDWITKVKVVF